MAVQKEPTEGGYRTRDESCNKESSQHCHVHRPSNVRTEQWPWDLPAWKLLEWQSQEAVSWVNGRWQETLSIYLACRNLKEKWKQKIGEGEFGNKSALACMFLVFCFVFKRGRDVGMLIKREETSRGGNLEIYESEIDGECGVEFQMGGWTSNRRRRPHPVGEHTLLVVNLDL